MTHSFHFSDVLMAVPFYIRLMIVLVLIMTVTRRFLVFIAIRVGPKLPGLFVWPVKILFSLIEHVLVLLYKIFGNKLGSRHFRHWEDFGFWVLHALEKASAALSTRLASPIFAKRFVFIIMISVTIVLGSVAFRYPDGIASAPYRGIENWLLHDKFKIEITSEQAARANLQAWYSDMNKKEQGGKKSVTAAASASPAQKILYRLKPEYDGGNLREKPAGNAPIVTVIYTGDFVSYLNESNTDEKQNHWIKVITNAGQMGWISESIVEKK